MQEEGITQRVVPGGGVIGAHVRCCLPWLPCSLAGVLVTLWIIDRLGRKKTMALCFVIFSLCSLLLFICVGRWVVNSALWPAGLLLSSWSGLCACRLWITSLGYLKEPLPQPLTKPEALGCTTDWAQSWGL